MKNTDEMTYLNLLRRLLAAPIKPNRTAINTRGVSHEMLSFKLYDLVRDVRILPLLTTKKVFWRAVYYELIWFLRGSSDIAFLKENKITIWDGNTTRDFLDGRGLIDYEIGETGPIYAYQWRNWNKPYIPKNYRFSRYLARENNDGIDQLGRAINILKTDPWDRRIIISAWNPEQIDQMCLPPCHFAYQFNVDPGDNQQPKYLNCLVSMRSADVALGVPFNIASYALLTHMVAYIIGLTPGKLSISMGDAHIYINHMQGINEMISRKPRRFPTLEFSDAITSRSNISIDDFARTFTIDDYIITGYVPHPAIKMDMAV